MYFVKIFSRIVVAILMVVIVYFAASFLFTTKNFGDYSTHCISYFQASFCGTNIVTERGSWIPLMDVELCEESIKAVRREGDWLIIQIDNCGREMRKNLETGEEQLPPKKTHFCIN